MSLKFKKEKSSVSSFKNLMENDSIVVDELALLVSFFSCLTKYENRKTRNMISLMLNPIFKNLQILSL
jgi:hypothetical protein